MRAGKQLPVLLNRRRNILPLLQTLMTDMNNFDGCFPPNRFPDREGEIINEKLLSKLFLAMLTSPRDWMKLIVVMSFHIFLMTDNPKQQQTEFFMLLSVKQSDEALTACLVHAAQTRLLFFFVFFYVSVDLKPLLYISCVFIHRLPLIKCLLSYLCFIFVFLLFHPSVLFAWPPLPLPLLPVFMHGTWWEELEPPSCHSSRLQFD